MGGRLVLYIRQHNCSVLSVTLVALSMKRPRRVISCVLENVAGKLMI